MKIVNGILVLERRKCWHCDGTRRLNGWVPCTACNGTGKGRNKRRCVVCASSFHGSMRGKVVAENVKDCHCADGMQDETRYDTPMDDSIWKSLTFRVHRSNRQQTYAEHLLGYGVYSCTDYGRHKQLTDDELIAVVRDHDSSHQACKFVNEDLQVCDEIGIFCNDQGYSVVGVWNNSRTVQADLESSLTADEGMAVGMRLYHAGMNGTLLAGQIRK